MSLSSTIETALEDSLKLLKQNLVCQSQQSSTHLTLIVSGWGNSPQNIDAIAKYLVGLRAIAIDAALNIKEHLVGDTNEARIDFIKSVLQILDVPQDRLKGKSLEEQQRIIEKFNEDSRNPWIAECIWHLCMAIAASRPELHPIGKIILVDDAHINPKDHGLDVAAIYQDDKGVGLTLIETKAYKNNPNKAINNSVKFFKEIDEGKHSARIRQAVHGMAKSLPIDGQKLITPSFWSQNKVYIPNPHYDSSANMNWNTTRSSFKQLKPPSNHIAIMPNIIEDFDDFFDKISDSIRSFINQL